MEQRTRGGWKAAGTAGARRVAGWQNGAERRTLPRTSRFKGDRVATAAQSPSALFFSIFFCHAIFHAFLTSPFTQSPHLNRGVPSSSPAFL